MCSGLFSSSANGARASRASAYFGLSTSTRMERSPWTMRGFVGSYCIRSRPVRLVPSLACMPTGSLVAPHRPRKPKSGCRGEMGEFDEDDSRNHLRKKKKVLDKAQRRKEDRNKNLNHGLHG